MQVDSGTARGTGVERRDTGQGEVPVPAAVSTPYPADGGPSVVRPGRATPSLPAFHACRPLAAERSPSAGRQLRPFPFTVPSSPWFLPSGFLMVVESGLRRLEVGGSRPD